VVIDKEILWKKVDKFYYLKVKMMLKNKEINVREEK